MNPFAAFACSGERKWVNAFMMRDLTATGREATDMYRGKWQSGSDQRGMKGRQSEQNEQHVS
jgi:hypothetical protein